MLGMDAIKGENFLSFSLKATHVVTCLGIVPLGSGRMPENFSEINVARHVPSRYEIFQS